ncbi:MAG: hypothetical protein OEZ41_05655 [Nitrospirota bacterium]|nr:hypothetical protein [Nitrospirota bacterium]MDH5699432.1 hypothetical protein [Nitrospirota bacterium]
MKKRIRMVGISMRIYSIALGSWALSSGQSSHREGTLKHLYLPGFSMTVRRVQLISPVEGNLAPSLSQWCMPVTYR